MAQADEFVFGVGELWRGTSRATPPAPGLAPSSTDWTLIGTAGSRGVGSGGIKIRHPKEYFNKETEGSSAPRKTYLTKERIEIEAVLCDLSQQYLTMAHADHTPVETAPAVGVPGYYYLPVYNGVGAVNEYAILVRLPQGSTRLAGAMLQFYLPVATNENELEIVQTKADTGMIQFMYKGLEDDNAAAVNQRLGGWYEQYALAL